MRSIIFWTVISVAYFSFFLGQMIADIGEQEKAYVITWSHPVTFIILFVSIFFTGFALAVSIMKYINKD